MPHTKIFLLGAYGQDNIGDEAILEVFLEELSNCQISVASSNPEKTEETYRVPAVNTYGDWKRTLRFILNSEVIVFGGGSLLKELNPCISQRRRYSLLFHLLVGVFLSKLLRRKVVFSAIGVGPLTGLISMFLAKLSLLFVDLVIVRDTASRILLSKLGFADSILAADPTLLLSTNEEKVEKNAESPVKVGICPAYFCAHVGKEKNAWGYLVKTFAEFVDYLIENHKAHVFLVSFQSGYSAFDDLKLNEDVAKHTRHKSEVVLLKSLSHPRQVLKIIADLDLIVGVRLHALIFCFLKKKPFLAVMYDEKVKNFVRDTDLEQYSVEACGLGIGKLKARFEGVFKNRKRIVNHIEKKLPIMVGRAELNFRCLKRMLEGAEP